MKPLQPDVTNPSFDTSQKAEAILHRIYRHLAEQPITENVSLLGGQMGFALFEKHYQHYFDLPEEIRTWERIEASLNAIMEGDLIHSFAGGISGIAWGFLHFWNHGLLADPELNAQRIVEDLDEPLFLASLAYLQEGDFDYLHGGLSSLLYFLERDPSPRIEQYVTTLVNQLEKVAIKVPQGGITWEFKDFGRKKPGDSVSYNLSLSHGTASIVALLALLYEKGYAQETCSRLIHQTLRWMWNVRNQENMAVFPNQVTDTPEDQYSRLAWCYGDLGVASAFYLAGEKLFYKPWKEAALFTLRKAASRREFAHTTVYDSGICHGTAGIAHLFQKWGQTSNHTLLQLTAQHWLRDTLERAQPENDANVFLQFDPTHAENPHYPNPGLLEGESGIGMVLLSALGAPTHWDRFLLLS